MRIKLEVNIKDVQRYLKKVQSQVPFANQVALNNTAFEIRTYIVKETYPKAFTQRNRSFIATILRVDKATKTKQIVRVYDRLGRDYLERHTKGGIKKPRGNNLAIPGRQVRDIITGKNGAIRSQYLPRNLLGQKNFFRQRMKTGDLAILERPQGTMPGKRKDQILQRKPLKLWYILEPAARIKETFNFYKDANKIASMKFKMYYEAALKRAMRTAR